jgi:hypothetical protein
MSNKLNPELKVGDEVVLLHMADESIHIGTKGVVTGLNNTPWGVQYTVNWETGSTLDIIPEVDKWMLQSEVKKRKPDNIDEADARTENLIKNKDILKYLKKDKDIVFDFLSKLQDSGITNMLGAKPMLSYTSNDMRRYIDGQFKDVDDYYDVIEAADESRNALIRGTMRLIEDKKGDVNDMDYVNKIFKNLMSQVFQLYIGNYSDFIKK